ncbi:unnamed protein product [Ceratitis capitata]|uniref:(Mediterranean fruit fly) hypothetical protein n=1 Tax=Ceratitis capitata TaxID=7213 RepID=A0A811UYX1_CERCA|nr:unnamed protein product [Ceratitis capitata]
MSANKQMKDSRAPIRDSIQLWNAKKTCENVCSEKHESSHPHARQKPKARRMQEQVLASAAGSGSRNKREKYGGELEIKVEVVEVREPQNDARILQKKVCRKKQSSRDFAVMHAAAVVSCLPLAV